MEIQFIFNDIEMSPELQEQLDLLILKSNFCTLVSSMVWQHDSCGVLTVFPPSHFVSFRSLTASFVPSTG